MAIAIVKRMNELGSLLYWQVYSSTSSMFDAQAALEAHGREASFI